jgi:hypothetical protein
MLNYCCVTSLIKLNSNRKSDKGHVLTKQIMNFDDWLTMHRGITLVNFQLDTQNFYLFIYNTFIKIL